LNEYLYFSTFAHEFTHILGFSNDLFPNYVVPGSTQKRGINQVVGSTTISGQRFTTIVLPEVLSYAKSFFGCPNLAGVPIENDGGEGSAGSHWEKTFLPQEYMNPTVENPGYISDFTMNLLRGSGWYKIDSGAVQHYDWGQGSGCGHFNICPSGPGYCSASQVGASVCSSEWNAKAQCVQDRTFSSSCNLKRQKSHSCLLANVFDKDATEFYGPGARCINYVAAGGTTAKCHKVNVKLLDNLSVPTVNFRLQSEPTRSHAPAPDKELMSAVSPLIALISAISVGSGVTSARTTAALKEFV
jgi:Leishmanolysin